MNPDIVVVDVSLAVKWVLDEVQSTLARMLLATWVAERRRIVEPSWFACEAANILLQRVRGARPSAGRLTLAGALDAFDEVLSSVTIARDDPTVARRALELAVQFNQSHSYDMQYVALAEREDCEAWTADLRFWNAIGGRIPRVRWIEQAGPPP